MRKTCPTWSLLSPTGPPHDEHAASIPCRPVEDAVEAGCAVLLVAPEVGGEGVSHLRQHGDRDSGQSTLTPA